jgi:hypothetical protein
MTEIHDKVLFDDDDFDDDDDDFGGDEGEDEKW